MGDNIQTNIIGRLTPCLQKKIDKTLYLVEVHFSVTSTQSVEDKLKRVILHGLKHGKQSGLTMNTQAFGCSTLSVQNAEGGYLFGRNFDWNTCDALVVASYPQDGYACPDEFLFGGRRKAGNRYKPVP